VAVFWDRLTGVQDAPPGWAIAVSAAVALLIVVSPRLWRLTRIAITIAHEGGHAVVSLLSGRRLEGIRLHADTSGETRSRGRGLGASLFAGVAEFAHHHLGAASVTAATEPGNVACIAALASAGFIPVPGPATYTLPSGRVIPVLWFRHEVARPSRCR